MAANATIAARRIAALRSVGVAEDAICTQALTVSPRHAKDKDGDDTGEVIGCRATNAVKVRLTDIGLASPAIDSLAAVGATEIEGPSFSFADEAALERRARDAAVRDAQQRARDYADAFGPKTMRVVRVSERGADIMGGSDIVVTASRVRSPVKPGEQTVAVTVCVDYAVAK